MLKIIDGTASELQLDSEALIWWRLGGQSHSKPKQAKVSPIRQIVQHLSGTTSEQLEAEKRPSASILTTGQAGSPAAASEAHKRRRKRIEFKQIVGLVRVGRREKRRASSGSSESTSATSSSNDHKPEGAEEALRKLKVYYAEKSESSASRLLKLKKITIEEERRHVGAHETSPASGLADEQLTLGQIHHLIERNLELRRRQRPKSLLIFVNPYGGKGKAVQLYERKVKRILELGQIESELVVTQYANHAREILEDPNFELDRFDGVVCIGGDGMFAELMNGLLFRANRERLLRSGLEGQQGEEQRKERSSLDLDSTDEGSASISSNSSDPSSATIQHEHAKQTNCDERKSCDKSKTRVILEQNNNGKSEQSEATGAKKIAPDKRDGAWKQQDSLQQQLEFLRSSLGGIGERFQSPSIPVGVIGAGSTDANLFGFIGTNEPVTATLNILLGNQIHIDVGSVHSIRNDRLLRFVSTFVAYGYFGDVVRESEKLRWLGPTRYDLTALNSLIKYRDYNGLVRILSSPRDGSPHDLKRCHLDCGLCQNQISNSLSFNDFSQLSRPSSASVELELERAREQEARMRQQALDDLHQFQMLERRGPFVGVNAAVTACRCPQTRKGFSPGNHLANGCADLILVRPCSRIQYINYLIRTGYTSKSAFDLKYVEAHRCRQFEFIVDAGHESAGEQSDQSPSSASSADDKSTTLGYGSMSTIKESNSSGDNLSMRRSAPKGTNNNEERPREMEPEYEEGHQSWTSSWNVDGEILREQSIRVKVNNKLLRVFGTGEPLQKTR